MPNRGEGPEPLPLLVRHRRTGGTHAADRRVAGIHRAEGLAGPTRRYTVIVIMLATMSSLPIIAGISAGSATVGSTAAGGTTPFIAPPSEGPVVVLPPPTLIPVEPLLPAGVAESLHAVAKREPQRRRPIRKRAPSRPTESISVSPRPSPSPTPSPSPSPSPTPSPTPPVITLPPTPTLPCLPSLLPTPSVSVSE